MLYDPKWDENKLEEIPNLSEPSLRSLAYILRNKNLWPKGFIWNYGDCYRCAMGLAFELWSEMDIPPPTTFAMTNYGAKIGNLDEDQSRDIFAGGIKVSRFSVDYENAWAPKDILGAPDLRLVTPEMVADRIEQYYL